MIPLPILAAGIAATLAFGAGWKLRDYRATAEKLQQERETTEFLSRNMVTRQLAEQALQAVEDKSRTALERVSNEPRRPISCPASGDLRDTLLPDLGKRLRIISESGGDTGPSVENLPTADPS